MQERLNNLEGSTNALMANAVGVKLAYVAVLKYYVARC
jgi:hypothetical protein